MDLLTLGETMGVFAATGTGPLRAGAPARFSVAGAESNVAIGMSRLGHSSAWLGRVGDDATGQAVLDALSSEGVETSAVVVDKDAATGLLVREARTADRVRVSYHRRGSAGSRLSPADVDPALVRSARLLHITGITPALGESAAAAVRLAVETARDAGVSVSFDVNYRSRLWSRAAAAEQLAYLVRQCDILFAGVDEATLVAGPGVAEGGQEPPEETASRLAAETGAEVVITLGAEGALALADGVTHRDPGVPVTAVDPVGAGDAFVAGYLSAYLLGMDVPGRLQRGGVCGAFAVSCRGDWEGAPTTADLPLLGGEDIQR